MIARLLARLVGLYQVSLGLILGGNCRFSPTCSAYAREALERHGALPGLLFTLKRILKCHPWGGCGEDAVPDRMLD